MAQILNDFSENLVAGISLDGTARTVSAQGVSVDMFNYESATGCHLVIGAPGATVTGMTFQVEEWNGTTAAGSTWTQIPNMVQAGITTGGAPQAGAFELVGLRTQRYARGNLITAALATNANVPVMASLLGMPKSSQSATGYSRSPSS